MSAESGGWSATSASVRGASHERTGKPNQDAVRVVTVGGSAPGVVAAVCDGHGGDRYVRSDVGSRLGAEEACTVGRRALESLGPTAARTSIDTHLRTVVAPSIVDRWTKRVHLDVEQRPFTDEERQRAGDPLDRDPLISYGCTLVLGLFTADWIAFLQIGDGDVTIVSGNTAGAPVPGDDRLVGGETTSLCLPTAVADARTVVLGRPLPDLVLLTSDGYANSFASPTWRAEVGLDLLRHVERLGVDGVGEQLASWLAESAVAAGDDVSMALIHRTTADHRPAAVATVAAPNGMVESPVASGTARRSRWAVVAAAVAVAALVGGFAGWSLADGNDESVAVVATTGPVASTTVVTSPEAMETETTDPEATDPQRTQSPMTTDPEVPTSSIEIGPQDQVALFIGERESDEGGSQFIGIVLAFDPASTTSARVQSLGEPVSVDGNTAPRQLPAGWEQSPGGVSFEGDTIEPGALAVAYLWPLSHVWVVESDGRWLAAYDLESGLLAGRSPITPAIDPDTFGTLSQTNPSNGEPSSQSSSPSTSESAQE